MSPDPIAQAAAILQRCAELRAEGKSDVARALRIHATRDDPTLFALIYLSRHLTDPASGRVTLSAVHLAWAESAKTWMIPNEPRGDRRAEVAPREMGKSTWHFLLLPMWSAAHGHVKFCAAFAHAPSQAETHLASFKSELERNLLLREDYPELCAPKTRGRGTTEADRVSLYHAASGFVFSAAGMDSANLGLKVGNLRPDLIVLDDIEPHEGNYSPRAAEKRLATLRQAILPLNIRAHVVLVGTVTMYGSLVHEIMRRSRGEETDANAWVAEEKIVARHALPLVDTPDGERVSVWPAKWSTDALLDMEGERAYMLNYLNDPMAADGDYWRMGDFRPLDDELAAAITYEVISVDPAVTSKERSDQTAIAAVGFASPKLAKGSAAGRCAVLECRGYRQSPEEIRLRVIEFAERAVMRGHAVIVIIETNQGGDLWKRILHDLPFRVKAFTVSDPKHVRAADALNHYQRGRVAHAPGLRDLEGQMVAFPNAPNDDLVDAAGAGVRYFLSRDKKRRVEVGSTSVAYA